MLKVSLTGGIGAGKTTIAKIFISLGVPVFFSDDISKHLQATDTQLIGLLKKTFGPNIYDKYGKINTFLLADKVFSDHKELKKLNNIVHPFVMKKFSEWLLEQHSSYILKETALPFTADKYSLKNDINVLVKAREDIRITRVINRNKLTYSEVVKRINSQASSEDYAKFADFIIYNEGQSLIPQVINIHNKIINIHNR